VVEVVNQCQHIESTFVIHVRISAPITVEKDDKKTIKMLKPQNQ